MNNEQLMNNFWTQWAIQFGRAIGKSEPWCKIENGLLGVRDEFETFYNWNFLQLHAILRDFYGRVYVIMNPITCYCVCYYACNDEECKYTYIEPCYGCVHAYYELNGWYW